MKDILVVTSITKEKHHDICNAIPEETKVGEQGAKRILETTWLLSGQQSFAILLLILDRLKENGLPVAVFEIESVLDAPK